jgi:hypothetical protein
MSQSQISTQESTKQPCRHLGQDTGEVIVCQTG